MNCITVENLSFSYPGHVEVFNGLSLSIVNGEKAGIRAPNGSGKSTLFLLLAGLLKPASGSISLWGKAMQTPDEFRKTRLKIGLLFQDPDDQLFLPTVEEDIAFALLNRGISREDARQKVDALCDTFQIAHLKKRVPFHLSWGQKRLVSLAGTLVTEPDLLMLDEPTAGIDDTVIETILNYLEGFRGTMLVSSHDRNFLDRICTSRYLLTNNRLEKC
ncbi:ABC transporter [Prosthecochloris marina]|uniref:ABC transporter n=1 Tax=Prosthecochloris marina TaxID=2017681 RepID=A0A317TA30_9CHLB|nr:ABC transporter ATP-binding protein [Prosthecochloris marina]PWW83330.1 ABC transporter [Prosthecochloris marina]